MLLIRSFLHDVTERNKLFRLSSDGTITYGMRFTTTLACMMDLHYYPLDIQNCTVEIESCMWLTSFLVFHKAQRVNLFNLCSVYRWLHRVGCADVLETDSRFAQQQFNLHSIPFKFRCFYLKFFFSSAGCFRFWAATIYDFRLRDEW